MNSRFEISVDGRSVPTDESMTVAAAMINAGISVFGASVTGQPRGPLCAMGICFECRVIIDGRTHRRACLEPCRPGMKVRTLG